LRIATSALNSIRAHGEEGFPYEVCGLLVGYPDQTLITEVRRLQNVEKEQPEIRYQVDSREDMQVRKELRKTDLDVVGYYHSHPNHGAYFSETDTKRASESYLYVVLSVREGKSGDLKAFVAEKDGGPMRPEPVEEV
jgi:proteasome lid subunit RPN8/RPN11